MSNGTHQRRPRGDGNSGADPELEARRREQAREMQLELGRQYYAAKRAEFEEMQAEGAIPAEAQWDPGSVFESERFAEIVPDAQLRALIKREAFKTSQAPLSPEASLRQQLFDKLKTANAAESIEIAKTFEGMKDYHSAAKVYEMAFDRGEKTPEAVFKVVSLFSLTGQYSQAGGFLGRVRKEVIEPIKKDPRQMQEWNKVLADANEVINRAEKAETIEPEKADILTPERVAKYAKFDREKWWVQGKRPRSAARRQEAGLFTYVSPKEEEVPLEEVGGGTPRHRYAIRLSYFEDRLAEVKGKKEKELERVRTDTLEVGKIQARKLSRDVVPQKWVNLENQAAALIAKTLGSKTMRAGAIEVEVVDPQNGKVVHAFEGNIDESGGIAFKAPAGEVSEFLTEGNIKNILSLQGIDPENPEAFVEAKQTELAQASNALDAQINNLKLGACQKLLKELRQEKPLGIAEIEPIKKFQTALEQSGVRTTAFKLLYLLEDFPAIIRAEAERIANGPIEEEPEPLFYPPEAREQAVERLRTLLDDIQGILGDAQYFISPNRIKMLLEKRVQELKGKQAEKKQRETEAVTFDEAKQERMLETLRDLGVLPEDGLVPAERVELRFMEFEETATALKAAIPNLGSIAECQRVLDQEIPNLTAWPARLQEEVPELLAQVEKFQIGPNSPPERLDAWKQVLSTIIAKLKEVSPKVEAAKAELAAATQARLRALQAEEQAQQARAIVEALKRGADEQIALKVQTTIDEIETWAKTREAKEEKLGTGFKAEGLKFGRAIGNAEFAALDVLGWDRDRDKRLHTIDAEFEMHRRVIAHFAVQKGELLRLEPEEAYSRIAGLAEEVARERAANPQAFRYFSLGSFGSKVRFARSLPVDQILAKIKPPVERQEVFVQFLDYLEALRRFQAREEPVDVQRGKTLEEAQIAPELQALGIDGATSPEDNAVAVARFLKERKASWMAYIEGYRAYLPQIADDAGLKDARARLTQVVRAEDIEAVFGVKLLGYWQYQLKKTVKGADTAKWRPIVEAALPLAEEYAEAMHKELARLKAEEARNVPAFRQEMALKTLRRNAYYASSLEKLLGRVAQEEQDIRNEIARLKPRQRDYETKKADLENEQVGHTALRTLLQDPAARYDTFEQLYAEVQGQLRNLRERWAGMSPEARAMFSPTPRTGSEPAVAPEELREGKALAQELSRYERWERNFRKLLAEAEQELEKTPEGKGRRRALNVEAYTLEWAADPSLWKNEEEERTATAVQVKEYVEKFFWQTEWSPERKAALRELIREAWPRGHFAICGKFVSEGRRKIVKGYGLDSRASRDILKLAEISLPPPEAKREHMVVPGDGFKGAIHINTGYAEGVSAPELMVRFKEARRVLQAAKKAGAALALPSLGTSPPEVRSLFFDHHTKDSSSDSSATEYLYETLAYLEFFTKQDQAAIAKAIELVTFEDNKSHPAWRGQTKEWYLERSWRTLVGLAPGLHFEQILRYVKDHPDTTFDEELSDDDLKKYGLDGLAQNTREAIQGALPTLERLQQEGHWGDFYTVPAEHPALGEVTVVLGVGRGIPQGINGVRGLFGEKVLYVLYNADTNGLFISSGGQELPPDLFPEGGMRLRNTMWIYEEEPGTPSSLNLRLILERLGVSQNVLESHIALKEAVEGQERDREAEVLIRLFRPSPHAPIEFKAGAQTLEFTSGNLREAAQAVYRALEGQLEQEPLASELKAYMVRRKAEPGGAALTDEQLRVEFIEPRVEEIIVGRMREYRQEQADLAQVREAAEQYLVRPGLTEVLFRYFTRRRIQNPGDALRGGLGDRLAALVQGEAGEWLALDKGRRKVVFEANGDFLDKFRARFGQGLRDFLVQKAGLEKQTPAEQNMGLQAVFGPAWSDMKQLIG